MQPYQHTSNFDRAGWTGWLFRADRGRLTIGGPDAVKFLQVLVSNDIAALPAGGACDAVYLTPQGRMITDMRVVRREHDLIVAVPAELAANLAARLDLLVFAEDVRIADESAAIGQITLVGESMTDTEDVFYPVDDQAGVVKRLVEAGLPQLQAAEAEAMRIEAGRARWGVDMNEETIPLEAGLLERAISQTKGCYVGQEVIVRVLHRGGGRVARRLMTIVLGPDATEVPVPETAITIDGVEVGKITSAARSRRLARVIALGYLQRDHANPGAVVTVGRHPATIGDAAS